MEDSEETETGREKRNIFGSIISTLTGLVSEEDFYKEKENERELEKKVMTIIKHENDMATEIENVNKEIRAIYYDEDKAHRTLEWHSNMTFTYWSRKVGFED